MSKFSDIRSKLKFVRSAQDVDLSTFPDFLIIGPQRTGTTWLHENLIRHPQVFMPQQKELYYFNNLRSSACHPDSLPKVEADLSWYLSHFEPTDEFLIKRNQECQASWQEDYDLTVRGEATATYAVALARDPELLRDLVTLNPNIKVMTMVRNPIDRAWSHAKKDLVKQTGRKPEEVTDQEWIDFVTNHYQVACGHYQAHARVWRSALKDGNYFAGKFDDILSAPEELLQSAFRFLGIRADTKYISQKAGKRVNPTGRADIPAAVQSVLDELYSEEIARLRSEGIIR